MIKIKRVYEPPDPGDGYRILVDRVWPRGIKKADVALDWWCTDVAPSVGLRQWFGHKPQRFDEFARRYRAELAENPAVEQLRERERRGTVTLVYSAKDTDHNQAVVLRDLISGT